MSMYLFNIPRCVLRAHPWAGLRCARSSATHDAGIARATAARDGQSIAISWQTGGSMELPGVWLRDNCAAARDPTTNQKLVSAADLSAAATTATAAAIEAGNNNGNHSGDCSFDKLEVSWSDGHVSTFDSRRLRALLPHNPVAHGTTLASAHSASVLAASKNSPTISGQQSDYGPLCTALHANAPLPAVSFEELVDHSDGEQGALKCADALVASGLCLVHKAPPLPGVVLDIARRLGPPMNTLYGLEFNVKVDPQPINLAYTSAALAPHMDLPYYEAPPGLQLLHCLEFDEACAGGESVFWDTFVLAELLRERDPRAFQTLCQVPATFMKDHVDRAEPAQFVYRRPHIATNHLGQVTAVFWSPAFEGPLVLDGHLAPHCTSNTTSAGFSTAPGSNTSSGMSNNDGISKTSRSAIIATEEYYRAYRVFRDLMHDPEIMAKWQLSFKLQPGTCVVFNQRRLLHGRTAFGHKNSNASSSTESVLTAADAAGSEGGSSQEAGAMIGRRWLQGCYVSMDEFLSRYRALKLSAKGGVRGVESVVRTGNQCFR